MSNFIELRNNIQTNRQALLQKQEELFIASRVLERYQEELIRKAKKEKPDKKTDKKKADTSGKPFFSKIPIQKTDLKGSPIKGGPIFGDPIKLDKKLNELTKVKNKFLTEITTLESLLVNYYQQFWALASPQNMVENWDAKFPIILMPIRIETRFLTYDNDPKKYLGVRFIPDDIFVVTHEKLLTPDEIDSGKKYWEKLKEKLGFAESKRTINHKGAWQVLNSLYGSGRAAYIALKTRPTNWPIDQSLPMEGPLQFPSFAKYKDNSWSIPPRSYIIPDKFVVTLTNGATTLEKTGTHVHAYPLILGPDPNFEGDLFKEDDDGVLQMDERIRWLYDFEAAVSNGMAVKIELNDAQYNAGFDKITVLGLRLSADPNHSQELLEELINNHHYGLTGFGIVPQGTPTNNSKDKPSGYSQLRQDPAFSFRTEQSDKLIGSLDFSNKLAWKDGQWLAHGLGINSETLEHSYYSNHTDRLEAIAMNDVLWHGTLGYYFKHMLVTWNTLNNDTLSISDIANLKEFFTAYISGRGPLPAIRVGNQPYGVLPITAYSKMVWENADSVPKKLQPVLNFFKESWRRKLGNVKTTSQGSDNWQQDFLDILGLQSGSVEYYNRLGIGPLVYYMYLKQTPNNADLWLDNQVIQSSQTNASINNLISDADLLFKNTRASMLSWFPFQSRIRNGIVTQDPISEEISLSNDYIAYLSDPSNIEIIIQEYIDQNLYDGSLLYGMLRHSFLLIVWEILWKKFHGGEWIEKELLNTEIEEACKAVWYQYINTKERSELISYIKEDSTYVDYTTSLKKLSHESLGSIPTERLERLLSEHLDLCSYRYDAWQTGLVDYKLQKMRTSTPNGCYLGAYGWVLNVRKDPPRTVVPNSQIPSLFTNDNEIHKLTFDAGNAGFIHAPSIAQATTSAVLREGYLSKGKEQMQVDLTSRRVRLAKEIIEGIQNGQELAALLGYRFERSLHDKSGNGLELDKYIYDLRTKFPLVTRNAENLVDFEANNVVHGLDLLKAFRGNPSMFNFSADENHLKNSCEELEEIIDAISDLTMAEGVHQAVMGNHVRANAILNSIGEGKNIPNPEIVETPRTGITLTQRMGVLFNADDINPNIWSNNQTYRSKVSPQINWWIGKILGDGNKKKCKVSYQISKDPDVFESEIVTPIDLGMQPLDFVILLNNPLGDESSELAQRIIYYLRKKNGLLKDVAIKIDYQSRDDFADTDVTFIEILAIVRNIYKLITESEVLLPTHLQRDSEMIQIPENEEFDLASYNGMLNLITLKSDLTSLKLLLEGSNAESNFDNLRAKLFELSELGIQGCISTDPNGYDETARTLLIGTTDIALKELEKRLRQLEEIVRERSLKQAEGIIFSKYKELFKDIKVKVGQDVPILPKFKITNYPEVKLTYHDRENLINHAGSELVMDDWLIGISKVKDKIQNWQTFSLLADISESGVDTKIHTMQLPYQVDDQWMGIEYNKPQEAISPDTTSLVLNFPNNFPSDDAKLVCGFIIDEWIEKIPNRKETTGIAFNYDEPQTEAPQAILLCVPPTNRSNWSWDDLISTLDETLEAAQLRAIDPDLLEKAPGSEFNKFLPGIVHPISSDHKQTVIFNQSV